MQAAKPILDRHHRPVRFVALERQVCNMAALEAFAKPAGFMVLEELLPQTLRLLKERSESPWAYHLFPVRLEDRDAVAARLRTAGIQTGIHYSPALHAHPAWPPHRVRRSADGRSPGIGGTLAPNAPGPAAG